MLSTNSTSFSKPVSANAQFDNSPQLAKSVSEAMSSIMRNKDATLLVVGYSPTGGGHTGRTLNIVQAALKKGDLKAGSTVVVHVPEMWQGKPRAELTKLANALLENAVNLIVAEADKGVVGYLHQDGTSNDPEIINHFAQNPKRETKSNDTSVMTCLLVANKDNKFENLPKISANDLMNSIKNFVGSNVMKQQVRVLTDMDPTLQRAADEAGIPGKNRVDQQNHAILLNQTNPDKNNTLRSALLAKVLCGTGEKVSHIGLGDKNTLAPLTTLAEKLGIDQNTTKPEALNIVAGYFLNPDNSNKIDTQNIDSTGTIQAQGVIHSSSIKNAEDVKNIVYVYANKNQNQIAQHMANKVNEEGSDVNYKNTLFVFCGAGTLKKEKGNALHLAYLAQANGIFTLGAGTTGEFAYLCKGGKSKAHMLGIPIKGHNEQEANGVFLQNDPAIKHNVEIHDTNNALESEVDDFVKKGRKQDSDSRANMSSLLDAVNKSDTYVEHARTLIFKDVDMTPQEENIAKIEQEMRLSLKPQRRFLKMTFQALDAIEQSLKNNVRIDENSVVDIKMATKEDSDPMTFGGFNKMLQNDVNLQGFLNNGVNVSKGEKPMPDLSPLNENGLLAKTRDIFRRAINEKEMSSPTPQQILQDIEKLKIEFGDFITTGF